MPSETDIVGMVESVVRRPKRLRLLFYDIETLPMLAYIWRLKTEYVQPGMLEVDDTIMVSWSAKWSDETKVRSQVLTSAEAKAQEDGRIVAGLASLLRKADYAIAHNGDRFDLPTVNGRLLLNKLEPLGMVQTIDTLKIARQSFNLASNRLDFLARKLDFDGKIPVSFDVWRRCVLGETKALREMRTYNKHDSVLLEHVFHALAPYAKRLPRLVDATEWRQEMCPYCGSDRRKKSGLYRTNVNTFRKFRCGECRREHRGWQAIGSKKAGTVGL